MANGFWGCDLLLRLSKKAELLQNLVYKGEAIKSRLLCSNGKSKANIKRTETYHIPNQCKFNDNLAELYKFDVAALIGEDYSV